MKPLYWGQACRELSLVDPILATIIKTYAGETLKSRGSAYETLLRSIVGQQISVKAAESVWQKLLKTIETPQPENLLRVTGTALRNSGLSERKVAYAQDLSIHFLEERIQSHLWPKMEDDAIIEQLTQVKGIGRWTAEMFLIFHLLRPNVFPKADLGLHKAISKAYKKKYPLGPRQLEHFRKHYSPWASVATWYLWRSLDPIPVEY